MVRPFSRKQTRVMEAHLLTFGWLAAFGLEVTVIVAILADRGRVYSGSNMTDTISCSYTTTK